MPIRAIVRDNTSGTLYERYLIDAKEFCTLDSRYEIIDQSDVQGNVWVVNIGPVAIAVRYAIAPENRAP